MGKPAAAMTATVQCPFGAAPATLNVLPTRRVLVEGKPMATIADGAPILNVPTFGMCTSPANPTVAAATAAALGVLTPMPCIPASVAWVGGATTTLVGGLPALAAGATLMCAYGGVIQMVNPGTAKTQVS